MKIKKTFLRKKYQGLEVGDVIETKSNNYMIVKNAQKEISLMNLTYLQLKNPSYISISDLENQLNHKGVPTHGGSCHEDIVEIHSGLHCKITLKVFE